jgi:hypothetical protein
MPTRLVAILLFSLILLGCTQQPPVSGPTIPTDEPETTTVTIDRERIIPPDQLKVTPETDLLPPILHSDEYHAPVPMPYPINTAGAEDSGFIMPDGETFYVWFTPDPGASLQGQLADGVTGIYVAHKVNDVWQPPEQVVLQDPDKQSLDGCAFVQDCTMWFCTARTGYTGLHWFTVTCENGTWRHWQAASFPPEYEVGELHITADGTELYFHSPRAGGKGQYDIWVSERTGTSWLPPHNVTVVNSPEIDGWPSLTQDGRELWFTRFYQGSPAIFRSQRVGGVWQEPELIISQFAGESSVDNDGNLYFTHHFYRDGVMLEADIYVAYRK